MHCIGIHIISEVEIAELLSNKKLKVEGVDEIVDYGELIDGNDLTP